VGMMVCPRFAGGGGNALARGVLASRRVSFEASAL
jgi:hypothetical protein